MSEFRAGALRMGREFSLRGRDRIKFLFSKARRRSGENLTVFYDLQIAGADQPGGFKALVAVPRRTGSAVARNKIRRRLRETIRTWPRRVELAGDLIVRYNPRSSAAPGKKDSRPLAGRVRLDRSRLQDLSAELGALLERIYQQITTE
ncbi:MAG TPA: ribonuclease P protein component [candidate division Zixibacteria bacterium]|nr:ribonuclease P protein component [candidate division Zixibacteria bacterium]